MSEEKNKLVVAPGDWHRTAPDWLLDEVKAERLTRGLAGVGRMFNDDSEHGKVGMAEAALYLYTRASYAPMPHRWTQMYLWCAAKLCKRKGRELPGFLEEKLEEGLTEDEEREFDELRRDLYRKRGGEVSHPLIEATREVFGEAVAQEESGQSTMEEWFAD